MSTKAVDEYGLNKRQRKFCDEYLRTMNAKQSAISAGYSPKTAETQGSTLLCNQKVKAYLKLRLEELSSEKIAKAQEVLENLTSIIRGETTEENAFIDKMGNEKIVVTKTKTKDRLKALELLGKYYRLYTEKIAANIEGKVEIVFEGNDKDDFED